MKPCTFCSIALDPTKAHIIHQTADYLAFLDIYPLVPGHTLVIPKKHFTWVWDVAPASPYFEYVTRIANHLKTRSKQDLIMSMTIGEAVPHAHFHLLPKHKNIRKMLKHHQQYRRRLTLLNAGPQLEYYRLVE